MITIEVWAENHVRWSDLTTFVSERESSPYVLKDDDPVPFFASVALNGDEPVGYHIFLLQPLGPEMGVQEIQDQDGNVLQEAKVRALWVEPAYRNRGIGTRLQQATLEKAKEIGAFQLRSRSALDRVENYAIKIKLGFAAHPDLRTLRDGTTEAGVYWVKRIN